jgi:hypothetical protein
MIGSTGYINLAAIASLKLSTGYFLSTDHNTASVAARQNEKSFGRRKKLMLDTSNHRYLDLQHSQ